MKVSYRHVLKTKNEKTDKDRYSCEGHFATRVQGSAETPALSNMHMAEAVILDRDDPLYGIATPQHKPALLPGGRPKGHKITALRDAATLCAGA